MNIRNFMLSFYEKSLEGIHIQHVEKPREAKQPHTQTRYDKAVNAVEKRILPFIPQSYRTLVTSAPEYMPHKKSRRMYKTRRQDNRTLLILRLRGPQHILP